jgi:endonuclease I
MVAAAMACGDDPVEPDLGLPLTGRFAGEVPAGGTWTGNVVAPRSGGLFVAICGVEGTTFGLEAGSSTVASDTNCKHVMVPETRPGATYAVRVSSAGAAGPFNGCWSIALVECTVTPPTVSLSCTTRPFSRGDTALPAGYYALAEGKTGAALIEALHAIACTQRRLGYAQARDSLYANVDDPDDDDVIVDVYVGRSASGVNSRSTALAADFNAEHTWPRSRGADTITAAGTDLHHLFTADEIANGQRLNHPFGEVVGTPFWTSPTQPGSTEHSRLGRDAAGRTVFEPRPSRRGDVARALLYFYVRYRPHPPPQPHLLPRSGRARGKSCDHPEPARCLS